MGNIAHSHDRGWLLAVLFVVAFAARLGSASAFTGLDTPPNPGTDEAEYDTIAWNLARGNGYLGISPDVRGADGTDREHVTAYRPPVTPFCYAAVYAVAGHHFVVARMVDSALGGVAALLVFGIANRLFGRAAGLLAGAAYAVYPQALYYNQQLLSETHGAFLVLLFVWCCLPVRTARGWWWAAAAGLALGLLLLCKPGYVFLFPILLVWAWAVCRADRRLWFRAALIPVMASAVVGPWVLRNHFALDVLSPGTGGGSLLLQANNRVVVADPGYHGYAVWDTSLPEYAGSIREPNDEVKRDAVAKAHAVAWLRANPDLWFYLARGKVWRLFTPEYFGTEKAGLAFVNYLFYLPILVAAALAAGPLGLRWVQRRDPALILFVPIFATIAIAVVFHGQHRYRFPIDSLLIVLASGGVVRATAAVGDWRRGAYRLPRPTTRTALVLAVLAAAVAGWVPLCRADNRRVDARRAELARERVAAIEGAVERYRAATNRLPTRIEELVPSYLPNAESVHSPTHTLAYPDYRLLGATESGAVSKLASYTVEPAPEVRCGFRVVQTRGIPGR